MSSVLVKLYDGLKRKYKCTYYILKYNLNKKKYSGYYVATREETLDKIIREQCSLVRYGDGEFKWMTGIPQTSFEQDSEELKDRLAEVIRSDQSNVMVAVVNVFNGIDKQVKKKKAKNYWKIELTKYWDVWTSFLSKDRLYYNAGVTRFYLSLNNYEYSRILINKWKQVWRNRNIIIIEGKYSRLGIGNDLFETANSIRRILVPEKNAFSKYENIKKTAQRYEKDALYLLAIGPAATVLAYDLALLGYQALDVGHIDVEYEWFIMKSKKKHPLQGKAVNECGVNIADELTDNLKSVYFSQILEIIE